MCIEVHVTNNIPNKGIDIPRPQNGYRIQQISRTHLLVPKVTTYPFLVLEFASSLSPIYVISLIKFK